MALIKTHVSTRNNGLYAFININEIQNKHEAEGITFGIGTYNCKLETNMKIEDFKFKQIGKDSEQGYHRTTLSETVSDGNEIRVENCGHVDSEKGNARTTLFDMEYDGSEIRDENSDLVTLSCSICNKSRDLKNYCLTCDNQLCIHCEKDHFDIDHELVMDKQKSGGESYQKCWKHKKYNLDMFCLRCSKYICVVCKLLAHVKHDFLDMTDTIRNTTPTAQQLDDNLHENLHDTVKDEEKVTIAKGVEWNVSSVQKGQKRCWTLLCPLL